MQKPFLNILHYQDRKHLILNTGYWKKQNCNECQNQKHYPEELHLITGSAGGIGKAIAKKFADEGACVIINDNNAERLEEAKEEFQKQYGKDVFAADVLDVTNADTIEQSICRLLHLLLVVLILW